jgi:hypothetical protein
MASRKRMRHLPGGDTGINKWPVRLRKLNEMRQCSQAEHDEMFSHDPPIDSGDDENQGGGTIDDFVDAAMVVPFPREHIFQLTRQMMDEESGLGADVLVSVHPGSGECLKAILHEGGKRGIGIARNPTHKKFILNNLREDIRTNKRATIKYPAKPPALTEYEQRLAAGASGAGAVPHAKAHAKAHVAAQATPQAMPAKALPPNATVVAVEPAGLAPASTGGSAAGMFGNSQLL